MGRKLLTLAACVFVVVLARAAWAGEFAFEASTLIGGGSDEDSVKGVCVLSDGTIVVAGDLAPDALGRKPDYTGRGCIMRLSADGRKVLFMRRFRIEIMDFAFDDLDNVYLAANAHGLIKINGRTGKPVWSRNVGGLCRRVSAAGDGTCVGLSMDRAVAYHPNGDLITTVKRYQTTEDVCIDPASKTIINIGHRFARRPAAVAAVGTTALTVAPEPFRICYLRGTGYDGKTKWTGYDWSTDKDSERFIYGPEENPAATYGYRCTIGRDGKLYAAFHVGGDKHIFRYAPDDIHESVRIAGGDQYHSLADAEGKEKIFVGRYDPGTGRYLAGQQFCARLASGRGNNVQIESGDVAADEHGRVYIVGKASNGLPLSHNLPGLGRYTGGAFLLVLSTDMGRRLACTRTQAGGGVGHCVDARIIDGAAHAVYGGSGMMPEIPFYSLEALQSKPNGKEGFLAVLAMQGAGALPVETQKRYAAAGAAAAAEGQPGAKSDWRPSQGGAKAEVVAKWEARLIAKLKERLEAGKKPRFRLGSLGKIVRVVRLSGERTLVLSSGPMNLSYKLERLKKVEKKYLAVALANEKDAESCAVAAFFILAAGGDREAADEYLEPAGDKAGEVRAAFE